MTTGGAMALPLVALLGCPLKDSVAGAAGSTVTGAGPSTVTGLFTVGVTDFVPATVALNVPAICPFVPVGAEGCVELGPGSSDARVTVAPPTGLAKPSRTVTVIVETLAPLLAVIGVAGALTED